MRIKLHVGLLLVQTSEYRCPPCLWPNELIQKWSTQSAVPVCTEFGIWRVQLRIKNARFTLLDLVSSPWLSSPAVVYACWGHSICFLHGDQIYLSHQLWMRFGPISSFFFDDNVLAKALLHKLMNKTIGSLNEILILSTCSCISQSLGNEYSIWSIFRYITRQIREVNNLEW